MAKFVVFDDFRVYAEMAGAPLRLAGHEVMAMVTAEGPLDFEKVLAFRPEAICVGLYRNAIAFDRPILDWSEDVLGWSPLKQMEAYPAIGMIPILLAGSCLREADVPTTVHYDMFLVLPQDIELYVPKLEELATKVKTRRKVSPYVCPHCGSRLGTMRVPARDLFCPRCHTVVSLIDERGGIMRRGDSEEAEHVTMAQLLPRGGETSSAIECRTVADRPVRYGSDAPG